MRLIAAAEAVRKVPLSERWRHRRGRKPKAPVSLAAPMLTPTVNETLTPTEQARIARWVASRIVTWAPDNCFHCRRPIVLGAKWAELVNDSDRARFHFDCAPVWRARQVAAARWALGLDRSERE